jgi:hypothetical protein
MPYTREQGKEFWFDFDIRSNPGFGQVAVPVRQAYARIGLDFPMSQFEQHRAEGTYPQGFIAAMQPKAASLRVLAALQLETLAAHFAGDLDAERSTFEDFGQGVLYDSRRPEGLRIHKMDGSGVVTPPIGYHRWYGMVRAMEVTLGDTQRWLHLARCIGLAWAIQSELLPEDDRQDNREMAPDRLQILRALWMNMDFSQLDTHFDAFPFPSTT